MEPPYDKLPGVISTTSGYMGGTRKDPTYPEVSSGTTGHTEVVQVVYDPAKVSYDKLLEVYWHNVDPTVKDRQFCDVGSQYRTTIFVHTEEQRQLAEKSKALLAMTKPFKDPIVTPVVLPRRGVPPGLLPQEPRALQLLPHGLRTRCAPQGAVGRGGQGLMAPEAIMDMKRMSGGSLRAAGYDEREKKLVVELTAGTFAYTGVTPEVWRRFSTASSPWSYFRDNIEEEYAAKRVR
jgi:methionine-S-sulfoxide reductase